MSEDFRELRRKHHEYLREHIRDQWERDRPKVEQKQFLPRYYISPNDSINGFPLAKVRDFLKTYSPLLKFGHDDIRQFVSIQFVDDSYLSTHPMSMWEREEEYDKLVRVAADKFLAAMVDKRFIRHVTERHHDPNEWETTILGDALSASYVGKPPSRKTAEKKIKDMVDRMTIAKEDPFHSCKVRRAAVFGDYVDNTGSATVSSLDIAIDFDSKVADETILWEIERNKHLNDQDQSPRKFNWPPVGIAHLKHYIAHSRIIRLFAWDTVVEKGVKMLPIYEDLSGPLTNWESIQAILAANEHIPIPTKIRNRVEQEGFFIVCNKKSTNRFHVEAYTVGLFHANKHPELMIVGIDDDDKAKTLLEALGNMVIGGGFVFHPGQKLPNVVTRYKISFVDVSNHCGKASWLTEAHTLYGRETRLPVLQIVFPDNLGRLPWDSDYDEALIHSQHISRGYDF